MNLSAPSKANASGTPSTTNASACGAEPQPKHAGRSASSETSTSPPSTKAPTGVPNHTPKGGTVTRLATRTLALIGAWWSISFVTFIAVPAIANTIRRWLHSDDNEDVVVQLRQLPHPTPELRDRCVRRFETTRCRR